ncbi:hypothetical protein [Natronorubrum halophilum]|uniref:hypothetical protein n=1 Tax=Natronorubrum halophilum TaxID=1702106 RepID=UPI001EE9629C|nr:hypothetical protein [Natronorubrum halophilum]
MTRPPRPTLDSHAISRRTMLATGVALVSATAGCSGFVDDEDDGTAADLESYAPAGTTLLVHLDIAAVASSDAVDGGVDETLAVLEPADPEHVSDITTRFESRTGLDLLETDDVLLFGASAADSDDAGSDDWEHIDVIVDGDWNEDDILDSLEGNTGLEYAETTYADEPVLYEPSADVDDLPELPSVGDHGGGRFVIGGGEAVRASLDVRYGDADPVSGPVREAYDDTRDAQLSVASEPSGSLVPEMYASRIELNLDILEEIEAVGRSYDVVEAGIDLEVDLHVPDDRDAEDLETTLLGAFPSLGQFDEEFDEARDDIGLERDGAVVTVAYVGEADAVFSLLDGV